MAQVRQVDATWRDLVERRREAAERIADVRANGRRWAVRLLTAVTFFYLWSASRSIVTAALVTAGLRLLGLVAAFGWRQQVTGVTVVEAGSRVRRERALRRQWDLACQVAGFPVVPRLTGISVVGSGTQNESARDFTATVEAGRVGVPVDALVEAAPTLADVLGCRELIVTRTTNRAGDHGCARLVMVWSQPLAQVRTSTDLILASRTASASTSAQAAPVGSSAPVVLGRSEQAQLGLDSSPAAGADGSGLGAARVGADVVLDVFDPWHIGIQGATRSGKSALSYTLLSALAYRADVLVCGVDPSGILLAPWKTGPGAAWIATGTADLTNAVDALAGVVAEMDARIRRLLDEGRDKLDVFDPALPLLLVVLEEYPGTLSAARSQDDAGGRRSGDRIAPRIERAVGRLIKEGAKVGVRVALLAQRMSAKAIDTDDRSNVGTRMTLRVDNGDAVTMLHDGPAARAQVEAARHFPPGMGLIEAPGMPLQRWRADLTDYADYRARVADGLSRNAKQFRATSNQAAPGVRLVKDGDAA
ncbi:FtsK/SpoIIIE domain-containing protein [Angustibacter aerolatus]